MLPEVTVTRPVLLLVEVFAETLTLKLPLLLPEVGVTLIQEALSLMDQSRFELTDTDCWPALLA